MTGLPVAGRCWGGDEGIRVVPAAQLEAEKIPVYIVAESAKASSPETPFPAGVFIRTLIPGGAETIQIGGEPIRDAADLSVRYALAYDKEGLSIFVEVRDDLLHTVPGASLWQGDSVQMVLDPGCERTDHFDQNDLEIGFALDEKGQKQNWCWTRNRALTAEECQYDVKRTKNGYFVAVRFPWSTLKPLRPDGRGVFGLNLLVNDNDGGGRKGWLAVAPGIGRDKSSEDNLTCILDAHHPRVALEACPNAGDTIAGKVFLYAPRAIDGKPFAVVAKTSVGGLVPVRPSHPLHLPARTLAILPFRFDAGKLPGGALAVQCLLGGRSVAVVEIRRLNLKANLRRFEVHAKKLEKEIAELQAQGRPVRYPEGLLAVVQSQTRWAWENLNDPDFLRNRLYRDKARRRVRELPLVIERLRQQIDSIREGENLERFRTYRYVTSPVILRDGYYEGRVVDDAGRKTLRPILFNGFLTLVEKGLRLPPKELAYLYSTFETMGVQFIQYAGFGPYAWSYEEQHKVLDRKDGKWLYDPAVVASERVAENLKLAHQYNIAIDFMLSVENLYNHERDRYGLRPLDSGFLHYQINDPLAREGLGYYIRSVVSDLKNSPHAEAILSFCLGNEPVYIDTDLTDPQQQQAFVAYLRQLYEENLTKLNRAHKANHASFEAVIDALPRGPVRYESPFPTPVGRLEYDWRQFKAKTFADWFGRLRNIAHESWPESLVGSKFMFFKAFVHEERYSNTLVEMLTEIQDINSCDNYFAYRNGHVYLSPGFLCDWMSTAMHYDLQTSLKHVVVTNSENHIINDRERGDVPYDHVYTALFQQYMHGLGASANWAWNDQRAGGYESLYGLFPIRPLAVAAVSQVSFDVNRLVHEIKAFFDAPARVAILYSPTSYLYNPRYGATARTLYHALNFLGYKIGFLSEKQIQAKQFGNAKILIAPNASHILPKTLAGLKTFGRAGGRIISLGSSFVKDDFDQPLSSTPPPVRQINPDASPAQLAKILRAILHKRIGALPVTVMTPKGEIPDGVEWRCIPYGDGYLLNAVNYNFQPQTITFRSPKDTSMEFFDLIRYESVPGTYELRPQFPILLRVTPNKTK